MYVKIVVHLVVAIMLGILFLDIGDDASRALNIAALHVCVLIFLFFCGIMPTILTCKSGNVLRIIAKFHLKYFNFSSSSPKANIQK
jgi:hypothetical protein